MLVIIDNYDSFTYNLYQVIAAVGVEVRVVRNDVLSLEELKILKPTHLMISPGPGNPSEAGISNEAISHFAGRIPVLGVCLGHQCLAHVYGGDVVRAARIMHGKTSDIEHDGRTIFATLPQKFQATRYHSLIVDRATLPSDLEISAWTRQGEIMGLRHRPTGAEGVQFHPESILCEEGPRLLEAFARGAAPPGRVTGC